MNDKQIKTLFDELNPDEGQKKKLWDNIQSTKPKKNYRKILLIAAVIIAAAVISSLGINAVSGGRFFEPLKTLFNGDEVLGQAANIADIDPIYAPDINYIDDSTIIFATQRGVIVYDRKAKKPLYTVDLQKINGLYIEFGYEFEEPEYKTHILKDRNEVIVFNTKKGFSHENREPFGNACCCGLSKGKVVYKTISDTGKILEYYNKWKEFNKSYVDTFDTFFDYLERNDYNGGNGMYSCFSLEWKDSKGRKLRSFLTVDGTEYRLRSFSDSAQKPESEELVIISNADRKAYKKASRLPKFRYTGSDKELAAIISYRQRETEDELSNGEVWIPAYVVHGRVKKDSELLIFGAFWEFTYMRNGKLIEEVSGGENSCCFHLKESGTGYKVTDVDQPREGDFLYEDIERMTADYPDIKFKMLHENRYNVKEFMEMYVKDNKLDIEYYYDSGELVRIE